MKRLCFLLAVVSVTALVAIAIAVAKGGYQ